jgi:hypothetical protein
VRLFAQWRKPYIPRKLQSRIFQMPQPMGFRIRGLGLRGWLIIFVSLSVVVAIAVAIAVVAIGVFLFVLPVLAVAAALTYVFGRTKSRQRDKPGKSPIIIEGEFRRVDPSDFEREPPRQN